VKIRVLGSLEACDGAGPIDLGGTKRRTVLALLALSPNEVVPTDRLIDVLWGEAPPRLATGALQNHVSRLRKSLGSDTIATHGWGYVLRVDEDAVDVSTFRRLVAEAERLPANERAAALNEALSLWRGPPLADLRSEEGLTAVIAQLEELRLDALERRIDADLECGRDGELVAELEALITQHPLHEHFRWQLILALYRAGRQAEALEVYRETRGLLVEELGLEPSLELRELERAILRQDPALAVAHATRAVTGERATRTGRARRRAAAAIGGLLVVGLLVAAFVSLGALAFGRRDHASPAAVAHVAKPGVQRAHSVRRVVPQAPARSIGRSTPASATARRRAPAKPQQQPITSVTRRLTPHPTPTAPSATTTQPTTTTRAHTTTPAQTTPVTTTPAITPTADARSIVDEFEGTQPATGVWWPTANRPDLRVAESHGAVTVDVPASAGDNFGASVNTRCRAQGDFDARLAYHLVNWPGADGIYVNLAASDIRGVNVYRTDDFGEEYGAYFPPGGNTLPTSDSQGVLRLVRTGASFTGYVGDGTTWTTIFSGPGATTDTRITIGVFNMSDTGAFAGKTATIAFDRFELHADAIRC
jgi:DNA-binding SARP family transcriptional activator